MATVGQDTFTEAANTDLASHTPDVGAGWSVQTASAFRDVGGTDDVAHQNASLERARKGDDIGGDQMDVSADVKVSGNTGRIAGVCARMSTDGYADQYEAYLLREGSGTQKTVKLFKNVGGTRTELGSATITLGDNTYTTLKLSIASGSQKVYTAGVERIAATEADSTLSGRKYAGLLMLGTSFGDNTRIDNFLSESVAATVALAGAAAVAFAAAAGALDVAAPLASAVAPVVFAAAATLTVAGSGVDLVGAAAVVFGAAAEAPAVAQALAGAASVVFVGSAVLDSAQAPSVLIFARRLIRWR